MRKLVIAIVTCALALMAILVLLLATLDIGRYRGLIEAQLGQALGRDVSLAGPMHLGLALHPTLVAERVGIANPAWASGPRLFTAERVEARIGLLPLLSRRFEIDRLLVSGADLALESAADGRRNWELAEAPPPAMPEPAWLVRAAAAADTSTAAPGLAIAGWTVLVREVRVRGSRVAFRDSTRGADRELRLGQVSLRADAAEAPIAVDLEGEFDGRPMRLRGEICPLAALLGGAGRCPIALAGTASGLDVEVAGNAARRGGDGLDLHVAVSAPDAATLQSVAGPHLPYDWLLEGTGPLRAEGRLTDRAEEPAVEGLTLSGRLSGLDLQVNGSIADIAGIGGVDLRVAAKGDPVGLRALLPALQAGELSLAARIRGDAQALHVDDLAIRQGSSELAGRLEIAVDGSRPKIRAALTSQRLTLPVPAKAETAGGDAADRARAPLFPDEPFDVDWLRTADAELSLQVARAILGPYDLREFALQATLQAGVLDVDRFSAAMAGSPIEASLTLNAGGELPDARLRLDSAALDLGALLSVSGITDLVRATGRLHAELRATGASPHAMARSLAGRIDAVFDNGRINADAVRRPMIGLRRFVGALVPPLRPEWAELSCLAAAFEIADGVARPEAMFIDSAVSSAVGTGKIDIGGERYALTVTSHAKGLDLDLGVPIRITGRLDAPEVGLDEKRAVEGLGALVGKLLLPPALAGGTAGFVGKDSPCLRSAEAGGRQDPGPVPGSDRDPAAAILKGLGEGIREWLPR